MIWSTPLFSPMRHLRALLLVCCCCGLAVACTPANATTFYVDQAAANASDQNPGTAAKPWKTLNRASSAAELKPADTVFVKSGVYREAVSITRSGVPGKPITFAAASGAEVVIKGSKIITGAWTSLSSDPTLTQPYPNAFSSVWKIHLDASYFQGLDPDKHFVSRVFVADGPALQEIGIDPIAPDTGELSPVGKDLNSIYQNSFYFDKATQTLYVDIDGRPEWSAIEVGTLPTVLQADKIHDVIIRGFHIRQNRSVNLWPMAKIEDSERVTVTDCSFTESDFGGFSFGRDHDCRMTRCALDDNGDNGFGFYMCTNCLLDHSQMNGNNTRHFNPGWHAGGSKNIPDNVRCTIANCVAANNEDCPGIWFDDGNTDCRIIHNVVYNNGTGIMYEISSGATIADNLVFSNSGRGIYISGSSACRIVHNTVAGNNQGIVCMPREAPHVLTNTWVQNNLCLNDDVAAQQFVGCELILWQDETPGANTSAANNHSKSNLYATGLGMPTMRADWNSDLSLADWKQKHGEDQGSRATPFQYDLTEDAFKITDAAANPKRAIATPLPSGLPWKPLNRHFVGSSLTAWPIPKL